MATTGSRAALVIDGVLGDDGRIRTSRNDGNDEPLYGVDGLSPDELTELIRTPGNRHVAIIHLEGQLKKTVT